MPGKAKSIAITFLHTPKAINLNDLYGEIGQRERDGGVIDLPQPQTAQVCSYLLDVLAEHMADDPQFYNDFACLLHERAKKQEASA